jgi:type VI secretion system protein ImpA
MALASAAAGKPEQQFGDTIIPATEPDWVDVIERATALLGRSKDVRTALLLTRALTNTSGLHGLGEGLRVVRSLLENHWEDVHPRLAYDGVADPFLRASAISALADDGGLVRDIRAATLFNTSGGPITLRAAEASLKREKSSSATFTEEQLRQAAQAGIKDERAAIHTIRSTLEHCRAIAAVAGERMPGEDTPDLGPLVGLLQTIERLVPTTEGDGAAQPEETVGAAPTGSAALTGEVRTRQDALRALQSVCDYLERTEPSSPAPLFIRRAQRLIGSGFIDIMRDMAPESLGHIEMITGQTRSQPKSEEAQ